MKNNKSILLAVIAILLCWSLTGCGRTNTATKELSGFTQNYSGDDAGYTMARGAYEYAAADMDDMDEVYEEAFYEEESSAVSSSDPGGAGDEAIPSPSSDDSDTIQKEKLVYTGNLTVETTDFESTLARIKQDITEMGGFIESEDDSDDDYGWYVDGYSKSSSTLRAYIQARIPSARFYEFMDGVEGNNAKVTRKSVNVQNISRQYSETATTIESYEIQERRLLAMMEDASRVSDMLEIESRLSDVQRSLKQYRNSLSGMDTDVAYSTVSISIREVGIYSQPEATSFGEKIRESFSDGLYSFIDGVQAFCIWFVGNILGIITFILILYILIALIRKIRRRKRSGKSKRPVRFWRKKEEVSGDTKQDSAPDDSAKGSNSEV